jgi:tetratricopeptide (TPR) repeat protein
VGAKPGQPPDDEEERDADASEPVPNERTASAPPLAPVDTPAADEALLVPILDRLGSEAWRAAENKLLGLLSSGELTTHGGRLLATLGLVQAQVLGHFDLRGALATLLPILDDAEAGRLPRAVAARAHVLGALLFSAADARVFDTGRANAHAARAEALLGAADPGHDDLRVFLATACMSGARFLGPAVLARTYQAHAPALARATNLLARFLAEGLHSAAALIRGDSAALARHNEAQIAVAERLNVPQLHVAVLADVAWRNLRQSATPDEVLVVTKVARERAQAAAMLATEALLRVYACETEAYLRLGRFLEAEAAYRAGLALARLAGAPIYPLAQVAAHLFSMLNRHADIEAVADELESEGPPRPGVDHHALFARSVALLLSGATDRAIDTIERVCTAPETAPWMDYLRHDAHYALVIMLFSRGDTDRTRAAIRRYQAAIEQRPSIWHSVALRRLDGFSYFFEGRFVEARQKLESVIPAFQLLGDVLQTSLARLNLAFVARAAGAPDSEERMVRTLSELAALGLPPNPIVQRLMQAPIAQTTWREQSMCERLVIAMDRLSVRGLRPEQLRSELVSILADLYPGRTATVAAASPANLASAECVEVADGEGGGFRVVIGGPLDPEQCAALRLLSSFVPRGDGAAARPREAELLLDPSLPAFIATAPATRRLKSEIAQLSRSSATILITGESGSGKEVVARGVHDLSSRSDKPYIAFNCASIPRDLFEGQLFGYKKGAFTGASSDNPGVIRAADGGTLFLDEIAELPLDTQPKLLRFLENGEVFPLGEQRPRRVDVRVIAATHRDLGRLVREGLFREDLYFRLNVVPIPVPPLRERREDIVPLARMFIGRLASDGEPRPELGGDAVAALEGHSWPGNVRELRNVIERAMAYAPVPSMLRAEDLRIGRR